MNNPRQSKWDRLGSTLRQAGAGRRPEGEDLRAPHGFAARVVARSSADRRADATGLTRWRRWSLGGAAAAIAVLGFAHLTRPDPPASRQFIPVPALEKLELPSGP